MDDPTGLREMLARMQQLIPFNDADKLKNFMELFCRVHIFRNLLASSDKIQGEIFEQIFTGKIEYTIWEQVVNMLEDTHYNKLIDSMIKGNMSPYGLPNITITPLVQFINTWIKTGGDNNEPPHPIINRYGWHHYNYKLVIEHIDDNIYVASLKMTQTPLANKNTMRDLVELGINIEPVQNNPLAREHIDNELAQQDLAFRVDELRADGIDVYLEEDFEKDDFDYNPRNYHDVKPIDNQPIDNQPIDNQPNDNQPVDNQPYQFQPYQIEEVD